MSLMTDTLHGAADLRDYLFHYLLRILHARALVHNDLLHLLHNLNCLCRILTECLRGLLDLLARLIRLLGELLDLVCHNTESSAALSGSRRLDRSVQAEKVRLLRNRRDKRGCLMDLLYRIVGPVRLLLHFTDNALGVPGESGLTAAGGLPMSARLSVSVSGPAVIPVSLVRCTAKVTLSLRVDEQTAGEIVLRSVRVGHAPGTVALFSDNRAAESALIDYAKRSVTGNAFSGTFYIPENLQGVNASITDQRDKSAANAPAAATCLDIRAVAEGREIAYRIYPGANNTTDFNLERNHHYVIDATIRGADAIDTRVSTVDLTFGAIKNPCNVGETVTSSVTVKCTNSPNRQIYLAAQIVEGGGTLTVNGSAWPPGAAIPFCKGNETRTVPVTLVPSRSGLIRIRFTVSDDAGYITYLELTTYCQQSYPVTTVFSENSWSKTAHTPLTFSVKANQQNNTSGFTIRYELQKGAGDMYYGGIKLSDGQSLTSGANDPATGLTFPFSFTPTVIGTVSFRLTFTGANGQASVVEKTYTGIGPYKIDITPDFAKIQPAGTTVTSDGYSGTYYKNFTIRLLASTDKAVPKPVTLRIGLQYKLGEYETSLTPTVTTQTKTGTVTLSAGSKTGYTDLITYAASCIGYNAGMGSKIIYPGFYMVPKQNYASERRLDM